MIELCLSTKAEMIFFKTLYSTFLNSLKNRKEKLRPASLVIKENKFISQMVCIIVRELPWQCHGCHVFALI